MGYEYENKKHLTWGKIGERMDMNSRACEGYCAVSTLIFSLKF